jgi:hypothetical protein
MLFREIVAVYCDIQMKPMARKFVRQHNKNGLAINQYYSECILFLTATCFLPHETIIRQILHNTTKVI